MEKKEIQKRKEDLLELRNEGRKEAFAINAMRAHGKIVGMDTFSWINPNIDQLTSVLSSFPFRIIWIATQKQLRHCLDIQPSISKNIETVIIHDTNISDLNEEEFFNIKNIITVSNTKEALQLINTVRKGKCAFLYSTEGNNAKQDKEEFEQFIARFR